MASFVLVHGSWHGAWCWYRIIPLLRAMGHEVLAPDLSGLGADKTPLEAVTLDRWRDDVCRAIDAASEPVILVGHSRGGILVNAAAEARHTRVKSLVYLAAFLLRDGEALLDVSMLDETSRLKGNLNVREDGMSALVRDEVIDSAFYGQCPAEDIVLARLLLQPEPLRPLATPVQVTAGRYGSLPRFYIECLKDQAISAAAQKRMYTQTPCEKVLTLDTDHSPFFSTPDALAQMLGALA
ncbi:MAG: alpha/beta fold hydrolase [Gammaproteobacteria bacterium]|nr:alpha/beta fold hydrolase [Gammaproteobacteria bacterium]